MKKFDQLVSINHQGTVIVFGRPTSGNTTDIYYNILEAGQDSEDNDLNWSGFVKLELTTLVRQIGMSILTLQKDASTMKPTNDPFRAITDQKYISIIQPSAKGTLYINRFVLLVNRTGKDQGNVTQTLSPAWEVRFSRSQKEDTPADDSDFQDYLNPNDQPFLEPSLEFSMINTITDGAFDVLLLPVSGTDKFAWQFFTLDKTKNQINLYNFPSSDNGLFSLSSKTVDNQYQINPDCSFSIKDEAGKALTIEKSPRAAVYVKHEKVIEPDGNSIGVKRAARVMITIPGTVDNKNVTATIDSAVNNNGGIANINGAIESSAIVPAEFDLYFDNVSYLSLNPPASGSNPLEIKGAFTFEFLILPTSLGDGLQIVGGSDNSDEKTMAPFAHIVDGDKLKVGFGNGTELVSCMTVNQVFNTNNWAAVKVEYQGKGSNPFVVSVNGSDVPLTDCTTSAEPSGTAVSRIGSNSNGLIGSLNNIKIAVGSTEVLNLPCNTVDYSTVPATTPNASSSGISVGVSGAKLEPSSSPTLANMSGTFYIDDMGISYYAAIADFITPNSSTCLIDGSDGLLHLYYEGRNNELSVAQFSTLSARASFYTDWQTDSGNETQSGFLNFVAHRVGSYMNDTVIKVTASKVSPVLCDIKIEATQGVGTEEWTGLPRDINLLTQIWNGGGAHDPDDGDVSNGIKPYFDYTGNTPAVISPSTDSESGGYFIFTSVPSLPLDVASVLIEAGSTSDFVKVTIKSTAPSSWGSTPIEQVWPEVPASPLGMTETFTGVSDYDYSKVATSGTRAYGVHASTSKSDDQVSAIPIFVRDSLSSFSIEIKNAQSSDLCIVEIAGATLNDVSRDQIEFAKIINGESQTYTYPTGYKTTIANQIFAITNGLTASVLNGKFTNTDTVGAFAYAGLLRLIYTGQEYDPGLISTIPLTPASKFQSAVLNFKSKTEKIYQSMMFGAMINSLPTNGATGKLQNTSHFTDGRAPILQTGVNGGWMPLPPKFCLDFNATSSKNYASINIDKTSIASNRLAISADLTLQTWLKQNVDKPNSMSRALTYNVVGNIDNPDLPMQYMVGSKLGPGLIVTKTTFVSSSYNFDPPNLTFQVYVKMKNSNKAGDVLAINEIRGSAKFIKLSIDQFAKPVVNFLNGTKILTGNTPLSVNKWTCLTVSVVETATNKVDINLIYNAGTPQTESATNSFTGKLGTFTLGSSISQDLQVTINGAAFWQRALSTEEVQNSFTYGYPDNDESLGIRWNLAEGQGNKVMNSAVTGSEFNAEVINPSSPSWDESGAFNVPIMGRNDYILASNRILKGWTHVAASSRQGYALKLDGTNYGTVKDGMPFNPGKSFAIEAWINPDQLTERQVLVEKPGSYSLYTNTIGEICLETTLSQDGVGLFAPPIILTKRITAPIPVGETSYVVVNLATGTTESDGSDQFVEQTYYLTTSIFINGVMVNKSSKTDYTEPISINNFESSFYLGVGDVSTFYFKGLISNVRIWGRLLNAAEILQTYELHLPPQNKDGLVAGWNFDDMSGTVAHDMVDNNDLLLTSNELWTIWQDVSYFYFYVDGQASFPVRMSSSDIGGYGDSQFTFGGSLVSNSLAKFFAGEIDDVRLYNIMLTGQQIREGMNSSLEGSEDNLAGYWKIDSGSGDTIYDMTGRGNNATLLPASNPPKWKNSTAPISNESESVINVLGGEETIYVSKIKGEPSVIEFGTTETDAYGNILGIMKRGYFFQTQDDKNVLQTDFKVGDLDTIYVGQVQSQPSVVGFIEGGPPLPSENQTLAYWNGVNGNPPNAYSGACSVNYQESETKTWSFSGSQSSIFTGSFNIKGGFYLKTKSEVSVGLGAEAQTQVIESKYKFGLKSTLSGDIDDTEGVSQTHSSSIKITNSLTPAGTWEPADNILNPTVGRRYIQNNIGIAIVKSATADLYMLALKGTKTPVSYTLVPNENIPVDTNIIDFPINPKYIKNGTLDGKVGLENDPDYPQADKERGSYFKPVEAYDLKQKIEKEEQQLEAFYSQFEINKYKNINSLGKLKEKLKENKAFNFDKKVNQRSIFNNYVWSAGGGLHKEEHSVANTYSENYVGSSSLKFAAGFEIILDAGTPFGGFYLETDVMLGNTWKMTASKSQSSSNAFSLFCNVSPTSYLSAPILSKSSDGKLQFDGYTENPAPGKVDGYRYMSFYLAPSEDNFLALKKAIDPNWLNNSTSAAANAMREATVAENGAWRILYRTTYVSRVPAPFQPIKADTSAPNIRPPANLASNYWLTSIIAKLITVKNPTPLEIGTAIDSLLGSGTTSNGILNDLIPWWGSFYTAALVYGTVEYKEMAELREDLLKYMIDKYESEKYMES